MTRWTVATNGYYGTASFVRTTGPWWTFAAEWVLLTLLPRIVPCWRIPLIGRIRIRRDGERVTFAEYYGDRGCELLSCFVNDAYQVIHRRRVHDMVDLPLADLLTAFGRRADVFWRDDWDRGTKMWASGDPNQKHGKALRTANGDPTAQDAQCYWVPNDDGIYHTGCGNAFFFDTDGPVENKMKFCGYCGLQLSADRLHP